MKFPRRKASQFVSLCAVSCFSTAASAALSGPVPANETSATRYVSTVQVSVRETSPELRMRSIRLVREGFLSAVASMPELKGVPFELRTEGNDVLFSMVTDRNLQVAMEGFGPRVFSEVGDRAAMRGRAMLYRASLGPTNDRYLEVKLDPSRTMLRSISAHSVKLIDLLQEIQLQLGNLNYLIPGECADRLIELEMNSDTEPPKSVEEFLNVLATAYALRVERKSGMHVFSGDCNAEVPTVHRAVRTPMPQDVLQRAFVPVTAGARPGTRPNQGVYFRLQPFGG